MKSYGVCDENLFGLFNFDDQFKISKFNRAWFYFIRDGCKEEFECDDCIKLELGFQIF